MALESSQYDVIYGKLLSLNFLPEQAKLLAKTLYQISIDLGVSVAEIFKYVDSSGLKFENDIYDKLNKKRTNSSQIGYLDPNNISQSIASQVVSNESIPTLSPEQGY